MTVLLGSSLASEDFFNLLTCGKRSLVSGTQNEIVVSWITLWRMIKVYWLDFSLHFWSCCLLCICRKFGPKLASHYKPVENEVKFVELSEPCSANSNSIKKRIIVRRTVRSMFGEQTFAQLRTGLKQILLPKPTPAQENGNWCHAPVVVKGKRTPIRHRLPHPNIKNIYRSSHFCHCGTGSPRPRVEVHRWPIGTQQCSIFFIIII